MKKVLYFFLSLLVVSSVFAQSEPAAPAAGYTFYPKSAKTGDTIYFYGNTSYDIDGTISEYLWDFGDGNNAVGPVVTHEYFAIGNHQVSLTVIDDQGLRSTQIQHVSIPLKGEGSPEPGNLEFEESTEGFFTNAGSITMSGDQAFMGNYSLKWEAVASGNGSIEIALDRDLGIIKGSEVIFRIWVPESNDINWIQPFVLVHNSDWSYNKWHGAWTNFESLEKQAWNEFSLSLQADLPDGLEHKLGVQINVEQASEFSVFIDSIDWPDSAGNDASINFDFEESTQGFGTEQGSLSLTDAPVHSGVSALQWDLATDSSAVAEIKFDGPLGIVNGSRVLMRVWVPDEATINWVQAYVMPHNSDWSYTKWHGDYKDNNTLIKGAWNEFAVTLGTDLPLNLIHMLGVQVSVSEAADFSVYVDAIDWPEGSVPPFASFDYDITRPAVDEIVTFSAMGSSDSNFNAHDADGYITEYSWDMGDGTTFNEASITHSYQTPGKYPVSLTVTDNDGFSHSVTRIIWCGQEEKPFAPPLDIRGTDIVDSLGNVMIPTGLAIIDTQVFTKKDFEYLKKEWKVEIMRLPLITTRWYYTDESARQAYLANIDNYLDWCRELEIYVMFDGWHEGGQGNEPEEWEAVKDAWHILMQRYADRDHVLWEVFNEPNRTTWEQWAPMAEELIDIVRSYSPVVTACGVPGVTWSQEFSADTRPINRDKVFYMPHPYPQAYGATWTTERWDQEFGYIFNQGIGPVFITEFGYPLFNKGDRMGYGEPILKYFDMRQTGWLGWIYGGWEGPVATNPKADIPDDFRLFWEFFNGVWAVTYDLKVEGGTGSGPYSSGDPVDIKWQPPQVAEYELAVFDGWSGDTGYLADPTAETTTVTIPKKDLAIAANYYVIDTRISIEYQTSQWNTGFITTVIITNNTGEDIQGWELEFSLDNQIITQYWTCDATQSGSNVILTNLSYNEIIRNNDNVTIGFLGDYTGENPKPDRFILNGSYIQAVE